MTKSWLIILILMFSGNSFSQSFSDSEYESTRRHYYGGYLGIDLGLINQYEAAPLIGYKLTPTWHAGLGGKYMYHYDKRLGNVFRAHIFGPFIYSDLVAVKDLNKLFPFRLIDASFFIHGEFNMLSLPQDQFDFKNNHPGKTRFFQPVGLAGIGLRRHAGENKNIHILFMMDVSGDESRVYSDLIFRFGFMF